MVIESNLEGLHPCNPRDPWSLRWVYPAAALSGLSPSRFDGAWICGVCNFPPLSIAALASQPSLNSRLPRILAAIGVVLVVAFIVWKRQPPPVAPTPAAQFVPPPAAAPEVAIEDGKTIDFSKGAAEIRSTPTDQAIIDAALKEMQEATKSISFEAPAKAAP